uniref:Uncharacterized protein n=1 Tax=Anguilla anguilla TaxID=7936 RepID=A0A0E9U3D4_ANGAN
MKTRQNCNLKGKIPFTLAVI